MAQVKFSDHILAPGTHAARPAVADVPVGSLYPCNDHGLIYRSNGLAWAVWGSGGGAGPWVQVVNESGGSFANWASIGGGTWASSGGVIQQTNTGGGPFVARLTTPKPVNSVAVYELEIMFPTAGQPAAPNFAGFYFGAANPPSANTPILIVRRDSPAANSTVSARGDLVAPTVALAVTINLDTWYKVRAVVAGSRASIYVDGVLLGTISYIEVPAGNSVDLTYFALMTSTAIAHYRNIKAWNLGLPS